MAPYREAPLGAYVRALSADATQNVAARDVISVDEVWARYTPTIWRAGRVTGEPEFYPVYRCGDLYSYSLISLILHKGDLRLNPRVARQVSKPGFLCYSGSETIDADITRLGRSPRSNWVIKDPAVYAQRVADAVRQDIAGVEARHPGYTNIILCGGKDSQNLLLLPWQNPVLVASAPPNYDLVKDFMAANGLGYDLVRLDDNDNSLLELEIVVNCCRNNLEHCRWGAHLRALSRTLQQRVVFWKGQAGDLLFTPGWRKWTFSPIPLAGSTSRVQRFLATHRGRQLHRWLDATKMTQRVFFHRLWERGAMSLGAHMAFLRQLTGALVLSGYHGPAMRGVTAAVDLHRAVPHDIRPLIGQRLAGRPVRYPTTNPGPPVATMRRGASHLEPFLRTLAAAGVPIVGPSCVR